VAYLVVGRSGRREFRWLDGGKRRSRRIPRGEQGDRVLAELRAVHEARAGARKTFRDAIASTINGAHEVRREVEAMGAAVRARLNSMLEPPLRFDPVHGIVVRTDRMSTKKINKAAPVTGPKRSVWTTENDPVGMAPTFELRARLASKFWRGDLDRQMEFCLNLEAIESELLDGDDAPVARMLVGNLVLTWVHSLLADSELVWETHRVGVVPAATVAMTRRAESLSRRFESALRLWQSYTNRTRGEAPAFPPPAAHRLAGLLAGRN
jgi:hypothetical protein